MKPAESNGRQDVVIEVRDLEISYGSFVLIPRNEHTLWQSGSCRSRSPTT
ncbi:hypothetical protein [Desulfocastanea catecholica]